VEEEDKKALSVPEDAANGVSHGESSLLEAETSNLDASETEPAVAGEAPEPEHSTQSTPTKSSNPESQMESPTSVLDATV
jgi:hypothetical protein